MDLGEQEKLYESFQVFSKQLEKIIKTNPNIEVFVRADRDTRYDNVAQTMSLIKNFKSDSINLITEPISNE